MAEKVIFSGKTIDQALASAAEHHGVEPNRIEYKSIEKKGSQKRGSVIRVLNVLDEAPVSEPEVPEVPEIPPEPVVVAEPPGPPEAHVEPPRVESAPELEDFAGNEAPTGEFDVNEVLADAESAVEEPSEDDGFATQDEAMVGRSDDSARDDDEEEGSQGPRRRRRRGRGRRSRKEREPREEREPITITDEDLQSAERWLIQLLDFARLELDWEISPGEGRIEVSLEGPDSGLMVEEEGLGPARLPASSAAAHAFRSWLPEAVSSGLRGLPRRPRAAHS